MNALLVANWPLILGVLAAALVGIAIGWLLRSWHEPAPNAGSHKAAERPEPAERRHEVTPVPAVSERRAARRPFPELEPTVEPGDVDSPAILLIDDRVEMLGIHAAYLRKHGYRPVLAENGRTGLLFARMYRPVLIVLDHSMPDLSGVEVARELKADPTTAHIPILLMTALSYGAVGAAAMEAGCEAFLPKPIEPSRLLREIEARTGIIRH